MTEGDTTFSTLVHQFHKSLVNHYTKGGKHLYDPDEMEKFCDEHSPGLFEDIFYSIYNDEKDSPSTKRTNLQRIRVVAVLHNLSFFRNQVWLLFPCLSALLFPSSRCNYGPTIAAVGIFISWQ